MPFLSEIVKRVNESLISDLQTQHFKVKLHGIATQLERVGDNESTPVVIDDTGNEVAVMDDNYDMVGYHRITEPITYTDQDGFGDENDERERAVLLFVVWANPKAIKSTKENLIQLIASKLSGQIATFNDSIHGIFLDKLSTTLQSKELYNQEYKGIDYRIQPEHLFAGVRYAILTDYTKSCLTACTPICNT